MSVIGLYLPVCHSQRKFSRCNRHLMSLQHAMREWSFAGPVEISNSYNDKHSLPPGCQQSKGDCNLTGGSGRCK